MYYKNFVDFLSKYEEVNSKVMDGATAQVRMNDGNISTTLLHGNWGDQFKEQLTNTVRMMSINKCRPKQSRTRSNTCIGGSRVKSWS